jgi:hypothetical protein
MMPSKHGGGKRSAGSPGKRAARRIAPKRRAAADWPTLAERRGVASFEYNGSSVFLRAGVEQVAAALKARRKARIWRRDVFGQPVTIAEQCFFVFRLRGHRWTQVIARDQAEGDAVLALVRARRAGKRPARVTAARQAQLANLKEADAQALSAALSTPAIFYGVGDTAVALDYVLFENGRAVERLRTGEAYGDVEFSSDLRKVRAAGLRDVERFVDAFFRSQDALEPGWNLGTLVGRYRPDAGDEVVVNDPDEGFWPNAYERVDFLAV